MTQEEYIEHEVKLRVHNLRFEHLEAKLNFLIVLVITGILTPILLHWAKLI